MFRSIVPNLKIYYGNFLRSSKIALDIGTSRLRLAIGQKGIVLKEPSFVGYNKRNNQYIFFGSEAKDIFGKAPNFIKVVKPIEQGIISDFDACVYLIGQSITKSVEPYFRTKLIKPSLKAYSVVPTKATEVEQRAVEEVLFKVGFTSVKLIEKPIATAYGAEQSILTKKPTFIIDIGAGLVEMATIIMGGVVNSKTTPLAGDYMNKTLVNYIHLKYGLIIGKQTAEQIKMQLFQLNDTKNYLTVRGKSLENGLPKSIRITQYDVKEALIVVINQIIDVIKEFIEIIPPETVDHIIKHGVLLTGGGAAIMGIDQYISNEIKIPVVIAKRPLDTTILGISKIMEEESIYSKYFI